jgi:class 3 adenylate cyclase/tetratricopeptide (TPR) repeat protein
MNAEVENAGSEGRIAAFSRQHQTGLVTLMFTDLVGSTQLKQRMGDWLGVRRIQEHHAMVRGLLAEFSEAAEISTAGDSFFLVFARPSDAVVFALRLQKELRDSAHADETPLRDRIGIHLGEVVIEKGQSRRVHDLYGIQVDLCARLMSLAGADQILTSSLVFESARDALARGSDDLGAVRWERHGRYTLKGIDLPVDVHEVGEEGVVPFWKPPGALAEERVSQAALAPAPEAAAPANLTPRPIGRVPWMALAVSLGLLILGGLLGWRWMSPRTERLAILPFQSPEAGPRADDFGIGLAERVEARLQEQVAESRTLRFSPLRDAVENGVTNAALAGSKLAADLVVEGSLSGGLNRRRLVVSLQARAPNGAFIERRSGDVTQKPEETLAQFEVRLARQLAEWLGASGSKGPLPGSAAASAGSKDSSLPDDQEVAELHLEGLGALRNRHLQGSLEKAVRDLRLAHTRRPDDRDIWADYAEALFWISEQTQDVEDLILAQTEAKQNATREPSSDRASSVLGLILSMTDRPAEAVPYLRRALELRRSDTRARLDLAWALGQKAWALGQKREVDEALVEFDRAIALDSADWYAYKQKGLFLIIQGRFNLAQKEFEKMARMAPGNYQGSANAGVAALYVGDSKGALAHFQAALAASPPRELGGRIRAMLGFALLPEDPVRAMRELDAASKEAPNDVECAITLAEVRARTNQPEEIQQARIEYLRALGLLDKKISRLRKFSMNTVDTRVLKVRCLSGLGRLDEATVEIENVVMESPGHQEGWIVSGIVYELAGQRDKAISALQRARQAGASDERMRLEWPLVGLINQSAGR